MVSSRLKDIIYKKLYEDLSHVEIIEYKGEIWFIDRENKSWYFIYNTNGTMWWKYGFFCTFFDCCRAIYIAIALILVCEVLFIWRVV